MKSAVVVILFLSIIGHAQHPLSFRPLRYDEDYSFFREDTATAWYARMKYMPLAKDSTRYLSLGGEIRYQYFYARDENWGEEPKDRDGYVLSRWLVHADVHAGRWFRTFAQLQSSLANSRPGASPVDDNPLELHQLFFDISTAGSTQTGITLRTGRQELLYGSQRLVSVRDGPNNRQSFDAVRAIFTIPRSRADLFYSHYVQAKEGVFDDGFNQATRFWGAYIASNLRAVGNIDLYYLGLRKRQAFFDEGSGSETRHSVGARIWRMNGAWRYDAEAVYQFGRFADSRIRAWTASLSSSYYFRHWKYKPELGLKAELISGDRRNGDRRLQTFNPLFPRGAYFGLAALIGPANLADIHPSLSLNFSRRVNFDIDYDVFWRYSSQDGIYAVNMALLYSGKNIREKHIGRQLAGALVCRLNEFIYLRGELTWFDAGAFLKAASRGRDILFTGFTAQLKF